MRIGDPMELKTVQWCLSPHKTVKEIVETEYGMIYGSSTPLTWGGNTSHTTEQDNHPPESTSISSH